MKAVQVVKYGDAVEGLELREIDEPGDPAPGELLIRVDYAPLNFNDLMVVWGIYSWKPQLPQTIGNEGAGTVLSVGIDVEGLTVGDKVVLPYMSQTYRERLVVKATDVVRLPADADIEQASMLAINAVTAEMLLEDFVSLKPGDAIAYNAATSGLAYWVSALAKERGIRTVGLVRRRDDVEKVLQSGCENVLVEDENFHDGVTRLSHLNIRLALDGVSGSSSSRLATLLGNKGVIAVYGAASHKPMELPSSALIFKQLRVKGIFEGTEANMKRVVGKLQHLVHKIGSSGVRQPVNAVYPISDLRNAVENAVSGGKVLLKFSNIDSESPMMLLSGA